jgi:type IV pilus modification protein PilV
LLKRLREHGGKPGGNDSGFTIIEVLIAMAIFAIGILGIAKLQISSIGGNRTAMEVSEASFLCEGKLEELMSIPYADADVVDTTNDGEDGLDASTVDTADHNASSDDGLYTILWNVAEDFPVNNTKTIKVIVGWSNMGRSRNISISCIKAS